MQYKRINISTYNLNPKKKFLNLFYTIFFSQPNLENFNEGNCLRVLAQLYRYAPLRNIIMS